MYWYRDEELVSVFESRLGELFFKRTKTRQSPNTIVSKLKFPNLETDNAHNFGGSYRCGIEIKNPNGQVRMYEKQVNLTFDIAPKKSNLEIQVQRPQTKSSIQSNKNEKILLECKDHNARITHPAAKTNWFKDGQKMTTSSSILEIEDSLTSAGKYSCTMSNYVGSASVEYNLVVDYPPQNVRIFRYDYKDATTLTCFSDGVPYPDTFEWKINGEEIQDQEYLRVDSISPGNTLAVDRKKLPKTIEITCEAINPIGQLHKSINISPITVSVISTMSMFVFFLVILGVFTVGCCSGFYWRRSSQDCRKQFNLEAESGEYDIDSKSVTEKVLLMNSKTPPQVFTRIIKSENSDFSYMERSLSAILMEPNQFRIEKSSTQTRMVPTKMLFATPEWGYHSRIQEIKSSDGSCDESCHNRTNETILEMVDATPATTKQGQRSFLYKSANSDEYETAKENTTNLFPYGTVGRSEKNRLTSKKAQQGSTTFV